MIQQGKACRITARVHTDTTRGTLHLDLNRPQRIAKNTRIVTI